MIKSKFRQINRHWRITNSFTPPKGMGSFRPKGEISLLRDEEQIKRFLTTFEMTGVQHEKRQISSLDEKSII